MLDFLCCGILHTSTNYENKCRHLKAMDTVNLDIARNRTRSMFFFCTRAFCGGHGGYKLDERAVFEVLISWFRQRNLIASLVLLFVQSYTWVFGRRCTTTQSTLKEVITFVHFPPLSTWFVLALISLYEGRKWRSWKAGGVHAQFLN